MTATVNALKIIIEQSTTRLETKIESTGSNGAIADLDEIATATRRAQKTMERLAASLNDRCEELGTAIEEAHKRSAKTLEAIKVDLSQGLTSGTEMLTEEMVQLSDKVEGARAAVTAGVEKITTAAASAPSSADDGTMSTTLTNIHSELAELTRAVANVQHAAPAAAAPAAGAGNDKPAGAAKDGDDGVKPDGKPKKGKSEGVMSAIAKLKQMRT